MINLLKDKRLFRKSFLIARIIIVFIGICAVFIFFLPTVAVSETTEETTESEEEYVDPNNPLGIEVRTDDGWNYSTEDDDYETDEEDEEDEEYEPFVIEDPDDPEESPGGYYNPEGSGEAYDGREYNEDGNFILTEEQKEQIHDTLTPDDQINNSSNDTEKTKRKNPTPFIISGIIIAIAIITFAVIRIMKRRNS